LIEEVGSFEPTSNQQHIAILPASMANPRDAGPIALLALLAIRQPTKVNWYRMKSVKILSAEERHRGWAPKRGPFMTTVVRSA
jgi:hypothetical protein